MVQHPAAKSMIEIARAQDEEVGDGTTTVIILGKFDPSPRGVVANTPLFSV
jgi:T-complex protein 1 subunit gamma